MNGTGIFEGRAGSVEWVHVVAARGATAVAVDAAEIVADHGIFGDWRARAGSRRQVTLVDADVLEAVGTALGLDVPPGASRRQVTVRGLGVLAPVGHRLAIGEVILEVTMACDPCDQMEVAIGPGGRGALEGRGGLCARVVTGGTIRPGDQVRSLGHPTPVHSPV